MTEDVISKNEQKPIDRIWLAACGLITAAAAFLRFYDLALKPFHHDEGVNGYFLTNLFRDGLYKYDPANYHGPTLYYISLAFAKVFGLNTVSVRASVAIFGVLTVVLIFFLRPYIGKIGSLFAALCVALSPGMVFISRYFIHEIFFVFLGLAMVLSVLLFMDRDRAGKFAAVWMALLLLVCFLPSAFGLPVLMNITDPNGLLAARAGFFLIEAVLVFFVMRMLLAWDNGRPIYLLLASASLSLMFATKETAFITLGTMLIACLCVWIWRSIRKPKTSDKDAISESRIMWQQFRSAFGSGNAAMILAAAAAITFIYVGVLFFSSFFTYSDGIGKAFEAYTFWTKTGSKDHTQSGYLAYLKWGMSMESPIFILSAIGTIIAIAKARHRFAMFAGLWAFGLFAAYSIIPYKTPWLALSFLLPMCIAAGYAINELAVSRNASLRPIAVLLAAVSAVMLGYQSYDLNFVNYDNNDRPYVYAHTSRQFISMMDRIEYYANKSGKGTKTEIAIVSPDYWPMVWYVKDYPAAIFHGRMAEPGNADMIVAKKGEQDGEAISKFSSNYRLDGVYALRPGVDLMLFVRRDLADPDAKELYRIRTP